MSDRLIGAVVFKKVTIADGESLSNAINVQGYDVVSLQQEANTEGTSYTFQGSIDGSTFANVYDGGGTELAVTKSATLAQSHILQQTRPLVGFQSIKIRTGTLAAPTNQTGAATILVGLRAVVQP